MGEEWRRDWHPEIIAPKKSDKEVLIVGADGGIYHQVRDGEGEWTGFRPLAGQVTTETAHGSSVAIAGLPDGTAQVTIVGQR